MNDLLRLKTVVRWGSNELILYIFCSASTCTSLPDIYKYLISIQLSFLKKSKQLIRESLQAELYLRSFSCLLSLRFHRITARTIRKLIICQKPVYMDIVQLRTGAFMSDSWCIYIAIATSRTYTVIQMIVP